MSDKKFKEVDVVLLTTDKASKLFISDGKLFNYHKPQCGGIQYPNVKNKHLYLLSDEEIKDGEWHYDSSDDSIKLWTGNLQSNRLTSKKIIGTTDDSLGYEDSITIKQRKGLSNTYPTFKPLPTILYSFGFIKEFVHAYNNGDIINKGLVEVEDYVTEENLIAERFAIDKSNRINAIHLLDKTKFNPEIFKDLSNDEKLKALNYLACDISTCDVRLNSLLNLISNY